MAFPPIYTRNYLLAAGPCNGNSLGGIALQTGWSAPWGNTFTVTAEAVASIPVNAAYTAQFLWCRVTSNSCAANSTFRSRKNASNGGQLITIGAGATGAFQDQTGHDHLVAGDYYNYQGQGGAFLQTITFTIYTSVLTGAPSNTEICAYYYLGYSSNYNLTPYLPIQGFFEGTTTEANLQWRVQTPTKYSGLNTYVNPNSANGNRVLRFRKNSANGNQAVTITASTTGNFADSTGSDICKQGDLVNLQLNSGGSSGSSTPTFVAMKSESRGTTWISVMPAGRAITNANTYYTSVGDYLYNNTTQLQARQIFGYNASNIKIGIVKNFQCYCSAYTNDGTVSMDVGGTSRMSITVTGTGWFLNTAKYNIDWNEDVSYRLVGSAATSCTITTVGAEYFPAGDENAPSRMWDASLSRTWRGSRLHKRLRVGL